MKFGVSLLPRGTEMMIQKAQEAEELEFDLFGVADSQCVARELYTTLGAIANTTDRIEIGPIVTNPVTRHPVVTASAIATINEFTNRAVLGIASGDSAVYTLGEQPARLAEMDKTISDIRSLWRSEEVSYNQESVQLHWLQDVTTESDIPIYMAAEGPRTLAAAGEHADCVIIGLGLLPEVIENAVQIVNEGARQAGRNPDEIEKWLLAQVNVADTYEEAVDEIKMAVGASAHHSLQFTFEEKMVPEEHKPAIRELVQRYNPHEHEKQGETMNKQLVEELGLTEYLANRYAIVGTPDDCVTKLRTIKQTDVVDGIIMPVHLEEQRNLISRLGNEILPRLREK